MRSTVLSCLLALSCISAQAQTAEAIMARVAANQDAAQSNRAHFVYVQHAHIASRKGNTIRCEETTDIRVTPAGDTSTRQLLKLDGRVLKKGAYVTYTTLPPQKDREDDVNLNVDDNGLMDQDLVENMRNNLTARHSKDGISPNLFPLTSKQQAEYNFHLLGRAPMNGHDCFHIAFAPKDTSDFDWKGDAYIDTAAYQPVLIRTALSRKVPLAVRMLLGTNVPGLGFTIIYAPESGAPKPDAPGPQPHQPASPQPADPQPADHQPADSQSAAQPDPVWFPVSFGTEFKLHVLFFLRREITFNAENRDFEKTHVTSHIVDNPSTPESSPSDTPPTQP